MRETRDKLKILQRLQEEGFLHEEDYEEQLEELIGELDELDIKAIKEKELKLKDSNKRKDDQIDYFTMLLSNEPEILTVIWQNFLVR